MALIEITKELMDDAVQAVCALNSTVVGGKMMGVTIADIQELVGYQGMNAKYIAAFIIRKSEILNRDLSKDVIMMVAFLCERGTNLENIKKKSSPEGVTALNELITSYGLVSTVKNGPKAITLARVGAAFPIVTCNYMEFCLSPTVNSSVFEDPAMKYPSCMKTSAFGAMIPYSIQDEPRMHLIRAHAVHQSHFSKIVNRKNPENKDKTLRDWKEEVLTFITSASDAQFIPEEYRITYCTNKGLLNARREATDLVKKYSRVYDEM